MAINIADSFNRTTAQPPFAGMVFNDIPARNAYLQTLRYEGMECYVISDATYYSLKAGITNGDWEARSSGEVVALDVDFIPTSEILSTDVQSAIEEVQANVMNVGDVVDDIISVPIGGTTGQILGKTSNLDGAIAWQNPPVTSPLTTKGDIYGHDGSVGVRIPVGTNGQLLTADSTVAAGVAFKDAPVSLPSQTGNAGKILETDGTNASWVDKPKTVVSATQTIADGGTITRTGGRVERVKVQASAGTRATVSIGTTPAPLDGDQLFIQGMSNTAPIVVGPFEDLVAGQIGHLMYDLATTTWVKVGGV